MGSRDSQGFSRQGPEGGGAHEERGPEGIEPSRPSGRLPGLAGTFLGRGAGSWGTLLGPSTCSTRHGGVAQVAEQGSHKPRVGGSSPPAATTLSPSRGPASLNRRFAAGTLRLP